MAEHHYRVNGWGNNREKGDPDSKRREKKEYVLSDKKIDQGFCWLRSPYKTHSTVLYIPGCWGVTDNALKVMPASSVLTGYFFPFLLLLQIVVFWPLTCHYIKLKTEK